MYWYPQFDYFHTGDVRQMPMPMPGTEMERMRRMMEQHMAVTNEVLRIVRENNRLLGLIYSRLVGPYPVRADAVQDTTVNIIGEQNSLKSNQ
ncbi:hypothetical protein [Effusibacillus lacus]|uniref:Uncharacterized protein n=1 Tax=Effusibacillus lacus TaxID=1348429 RepID=A0A292YPR2_9BACL|nr:hypothetical protein [Effusibacillus lacus]TCS76600.1 hypothetical protein EDD64_102147 [Effusibacillus lacus]GAX90384.1 hypothetical protein EFBL_2010 [Effusibacillus lacus]